MKYGPSRRFRLHRKRCSFSGSAGSEAPSRSPPDRPDAPLPGSGPRGSPPCRPAGSATRLCRTIGPGIGPLVDEVDRAAGLRLPGLEGAALRRRGPGTSAAAPGWMLRIRPRQRADELRREHPHVAGQADEVRPRRLEDRVAISASCSRRLRPAPVEREMPEARAPRPVRGPGRRRRRRSRRRSPRRESGPSATASAIASKFEPRPERRMARRRFSAASASFSCGLSSALRGRPTGHTRLEMIEATVH